LQYVGTETLVKNFIIILHFRVPSRRTDIYRRYKMLRHFVKIIYTLSTLRVTGINTDSEWVRDRALLTVKRTTIPIPIHTQIPLPISPPYAPSAAQYVYDTLTGRTLVHRLGVIARRLLTHVQEDGKTWCPLATVRRIDGRAVSFE